MFSNREGVNIDSVSRPIGHVFNYKTTLPVALGLSLEPILSRWAPSLLRQLLANATAAKLLRFAAEHAALRRPAWIAGALTAAYALNSYLARGAANNWVEDRTYDFDREIVLITGGSGGIGAAVAQEFLRRNRRTRVVVVDFADLKWEPPAGSRVHFYRCDLSDAKAVREMADRVRDEVGHPTVLLNNAGVARAAPLVAAAAEEQEMVVRTNLLGQMFVTQQFLPEMIRRDHGHIVYSSSMSSVFPMPMIASYSTTKAGLSALHDAVQMELQFFYNAPRVRQTLGIFGFIRTPMVGGNQGGGGFVIPFLEVETVSEAIVDGVYSTYGSTIYLPGPARYFAALRGGPSWLLRGFRNGAAAGFAKARKADFQASIDNVLQK